MRRCFVLFFAILFFLCSIESYAQGTIYRQVAMRAGHPWSEGLIIDFEPDEALCKKRFGARWRAGCAAALGRPGDTARNIRLTPHADGHWEWQSPVTLVFWPENGTSLKPDTIYKADLSRLEKPGFVALNTARAECRTPPLSVTLLESRFWVDPSPKGVHRLTMSLAFNFPVAEHDFDFHLTEPEGSRFGKPELVWNEDRDHLSISWPVPKLGPRPGQAKVALRNFGQIIHRDGAIRFMPAGAAGAVFAHNIPSSSEIFHVAGMKMAVEPDARLDRRYVLELETSLQARAADVFNMLEVRELPEFSKSGAGKPYDWAAAPAVPSDILAKSELLRLVPLQKMDALQSRFRFEVPAKNGRYLFVKLDSKLCSRSGDKLVRNWHGILQAAPMSAEVGFLQPGHILPAQSALDVYGVGMDAIQWEIQLLREPFFALLAQGSDDAFTGPLDRLGLGMDSFSRSASGKFTFKDAQHGHAAYAALDLGAEIARLSGVSSGIALVTLKGIVNGREKAAASRLVVVTDLGLLLKRSGSRDFDCFAHRLSDGAPAAGAVVSILGANGQAVASAAADGSGHVRIPSLDGLERESRPVAVIARLGSDLAWLPLDDRKRELDFTNFDVGGSHVSAGDIVPFVFSQRGLYRPGDIFHFGCLIRKGDFSLPPGNLPFYAELLDPRGVRIWGKTFEAGNNGLAELSWQSQESSLSGRYTLNLKNGKNGDVLGSTSVRLESFQPDTLKLKIEVPVSRGWLVTDGSAAVSSTVCLRNLYGTPAAAHKVKGKVQTSPAVFRFKGFEDWVFTDPAPFLGNGSLRELGPAETDAGGSAAIILPADLFGLSSARVAVLAEGYDKAGGRATGGSMTFLASPVRQILGYRKTGSLTNLDFIAKNEKAALEFLSVDSSLDRVPWPDLRFSILRRNYVTNLVSDGHGGYRYDEVPQELQVREWQADLPASGMLVDVDTAEPGEYMLVVRDRSGHILAQISYNIIGEKIQDARAPLAGSKMRMRIDKTDYMPGEDIKVSLSLPYAATGILSIEREGIVAWKWFEAHPGDNVATLKIPPQFEGRGHVVAAFMRSPSSEAIYMTPLAHAAMPFNANMAARDMGLKLDAPAVAEPGSVLNVRLSSARPGEAAVFVVDEGILQLTAFATPRPLDAFLADRALDVATIQLADLLMPGHDRLAQRLSAFGGGAEVAPFAARFQNPFKRRNEPPVAVWAGLVKVGDEPAIISIPLPSWYNGRVRVMAVGSAADAAGSAARDVIVRGGLVMTPAVPVAVAPGDVFKGNLILANTTEAPMRLEAHMETGSNLSVLQSLEKKIELAPGEEAAFPFLVKAEDAPGAADIVFRCKGADREFERVVSLSVRPAGALRTTIAAGVAEKPTQLPPARPVYMQGAWSEATASTLPVPLAASLGNYLETYPYGCTEQLVSRAFAHAVLWKWPFANVDEDKRRKLMEAANDAIAARFQDGRGVALWNGGEPDLLLTAYAADYLLTLRESGLSGQDDLLARICDALRWNCALNEPTLEAARASAYAIWVLAREGSVVTQLLEELSAAIAEKGLAGRFRRDIGHALVMGARKEMRMPVQLDLAALNFTGQGWFDEHSQRALAMTIRALYFPEQITRPVREDFWGVMTMMLNTNTFSTFFASQGVRALVSLGNSGNAPLLEHASLSCEDEGIEEKTAVSEDGMFLSASAAICHRYGLRLPETGAPVYWQTTTTGYDRDNTQKAASHGIEITSALLDMAGQPVKHLRQGDEVMVRLTVRAERDRIDDCVISSLLPGGLEMVLPPKGAEKLPDGVKYLDRQEDRVLVFTDLSNRPLEFSYRARAVTPGSYLIPGASVEAMYDRALYGVSASGALEIGN